MDYAAMMQNVHNAHNIQNVHMANQYHPLAHPNVQVQTRPRQMFSFPYTGESLFLVPHLPHQHNVSDPQLAMPSKQTEPKPRLAKDEVDLLENEFKKNPKPSSQRKREIAELLNVENPRINNWFQNRRAKAKQMLRREMDTRPSDDSPTGSPSEQKDSSADYYYNTAESAQPSTASLPAVETQQQQQQQHQSSSQSPQLLPSNDSPEEYPSPKSLVFPPVSHDLAYGSVVPNFLAAASPNGQDGLDLDQSLGPFPFTTAMGMESVMAASTMPFHSDLLGGLACDTQALCQGLSSAMQMSSPSSSHSPMSAISDLRFKSPPPPANLATRRNKGAPAMLNPTSLRTSPYGPKTGHDLPKRIDAPGPVRRISASGLINRIQKSSAAPTPRSPLYLERNKDAFLQSLQSATAATAGMSDVNYPVSLASNSNTMSPVPISQVGPKPCTPLSDEDLPFSLSTSMPRAFFTEPTLKTPPGTPGLQGGIVTNAAANMEQPGAMDIWSFLPQEEALLTPSLGSYGSDEFNMMSSAPTYVVSSQPSTPLLGQPINACMAMPFAPNGLAPGDYVYSGEQYALAESCLAKSSSEQAQNKQFQFTQNVTPDDFFPEK